MTLLRDVPSAFRTLSRAPAFTLLVVVTLALGIGASAAIFTVVNAVVLRPLPYPEPQQLVRITSELRNFGATDTGVAAAELFDYQERTDLFTAIAGMMPVSANAIGRDVPERVEVMLVSPEYFAVLGVAPLHGRVFGPQDATPGVGNIAVVSEAFWRRSLGGDPGAVGRTIVMDTDPIEIVGVMPAGFRHPGRTLQSPVDVWSPAGFRSAGSAAPVRSRRRLEGALARLQPGVTVEQAQARLADYGVTVSRQFPAEYPDRIGWRPRVVPLQDDLLGGASTPMFVLLGAVLLLLLVACANVAHLVLARSAARRQEVAIRQALGASVGRLTSQLATESAILAAAGGVLALLVASWGLRGLMALAPGQLPRVEDVRLDLSTILAAAALSAALAALFAIVPALQARRADTFTALRSGGDRGSTGRSAGARSLLVASEVAMATMLLVGAGLFVRTVVALLNVPVGFETANLLTARLALPRPNDPARAAYLDPERRTVFYGETLRRLAALPGVESAAMSSQIPMGGFNPPLFVEVEGASAETGATPTVHQFQVSPGYFGTMGIGIRRGRAFTDADGASGEPVAIVSETAARVLWNRGDALGGRLRLSSDAPWMTVVGVAADVLNRRLTEEPQPILYRPLAQSSDLSMALLIRTRDGARDLAASIAREVRAVDAAVPVHSMRTMEELIGRAVAQRRFLMRLLVAFAALATLLALIGIYGVLAYSVARRIREIGIRMAIGARQGDVSRMVLRRGMSLTAAGIAAGLAAALALSRLVSSQLYGVSPADPLTVVLVTGVMIAVALAAAYLPARRAARVDPIVALRTE